MSELSVQELKAHLKQGVQPLYVLYGDEPLQHLESADAIRDAVKSDAEVDRTSFTVAGAHFDWSQVIAAFSDLSLFAQRQLIEIHIPNGKPGREGGAMLLKLVDMIRMAQDICVMICLPQNLERASKNTAWFKALGQQGVVIHCQSIDIRMLPQWLTQRMAAAGVQLGAGDEAKRTLAFLAEHVEGNLLAAHQEIEKIALLYNATTKSPCVVGYEEVRKVVSNVARYDLFALPQVILQGQLDRSIKMLDGLISEGQASVKIHWVLANEISLLWRVRQLMDAGKSLPIALREARVWGDRERLFEQVLPRVSSRVCLRLLRLAQICDGVVKGLYYPDWPRNTHLALRKLVLSMVDAVK